MAIGTEYIITVAILYTPCILSLYTTCNSCMAVMNTAIETTVYDWSFSWVQIFAKEAKIRLSEVLIFMVGESGTGGLASGTAKS